MNEKKSDALRVPKFGTLVLVPFGDALLPATVVQKRNGRVEVEIKVEDADPIRTTFALDDITVPKAS
ncbi:hypothetical protein [Herbiconiux daphne]|uniref:Uncharacterized protein n=1 Tax=Herbiconiux daphne TaxID=2970914 RepID=A0ABT2H1E3_9MICO|nr:hypothetical protein [Herbiconiux daphne]MCS5733768.1 hypothetical protein [Herbiconiux daphne]